MDKFKGRGENTWMSKKSEIQVNDRVVIAKTPGIQGVVKEIRSETTAKQDSKEKGLMIQVLWDNGTLSYLAPEALSRV